MFEPLIHTSVVESANTTYIIVIAPAQWVKIDTTPTIDFCIFMMDVVLVEHLVAPTSSCGGIYFDGNSFQLATYSSEESDGFVDEVLGLS